MPHNVRIVILMGVAGSGKTTIGQLLAKDLNWGFYDGDDFHPKANVDKMSQGIALSDEERDAWLATLDGVIQHLISGARSAVIACSALKQRYRDRLAANRNEVVFVYLKGGYDLTHERLLSRKSHFMKADLLASQFDTLEEPEGVPSIDIAQELDIIVDQIKRALGLSWT
ncbi:MAG: gluconokinase [Thermoplasmata archaeon]